MKTKTIQLNNETLAYLDVGTGDTTLLFLHGAFINKSYWRAPLEHFAPTHRVVAVDLPGHGDSTHRQTDRTPRTFGAEICAFIAALKLQRVILIGHSFGADVMLEAVTHDAANIIGLVEIDHLKNVGTELPQTAVDQLVAGLRMDFAATSAAFARQALVSPATDEQLVQQLLTDYTGTDPVIGISLFENLPGYAAREVALLQKLPLPLHLLHVNYAPTNEAALREVLDDNYTLHVLAGTCHYPMVEEAAAFNRVLEKIVKGIG